MSSVRRQIGSRWFAEWIRGGGRVHRDQLPPRMMGALRRAAARELAREQRRRRGSAWQLLRWGFVALLAGAAAAAAVRWVMGWS